MDKETLKKLQQIQLDITKQFVEICNTHHLKYYIIGGTLLGAIRHQGFIPWDDDIDVAMPREDYEKFIEIYLNNPIQNLYLHCQQNDAKYWLPFVKLKKDNTEYIEEYLQNFDTHKGIFLDIFPLDDIIDPNALFTKLQSKAINQLFYSIAEKLGFYKNEPLSFKQKFYKFIFSPFSISTLHNWQQKVMQLNNHKNGKYWINFSSHYNYMKEVFIKDKYIPDQLYTFGDTQLNGPIKYDYILSQLFGNYMELPPEDKRQIHADGVIFNKSE